MENKSKVPQSEGPKSIQPVDMAAQTSEAAPAVERNVATATHGQIVALAAARNALVLAGDRLAKAKDRTETLLAEILLEQRKQSELKSARALAVDELEAALQAHDVALQNHAAVRAIPVA